MSRARNPPPLLLPFQRRWLQDRARVKVFEKSRRIGATWATAAHAVLEASSGKQDVWYVSYNEDSGKEFVLDCQKWVRQLNVAAHAMSMMLVPPDAESGMAGARTFQIVFPSGKRITSLTSSSRNLRGKQGLVIIDEAAFHDRLPEVLKAAFALLMWGGSVWVMSTHNGIDNPFAELVNEIADGKRDYSLHRVTIEDALAEGLYERICAVLGEPYSPEKERAWLAKLEREYGDGVREELYCEPLRGGQSYLGRPLIESCMVDAPVIRLTRDERWMLDHDQDARTREIVQWCEAVLGPVLEKLPSHLPHAFGWDFGRYADRSVLAPFTMQQNTVRACPFLIELAGIPHNDQWAILRYVGERLPNFFAAHLDAGGNGNWIAEQARQQWGDTVQQVDITQRWYAENMPPFREAHERGLITYPRDIDVRQDLALVRRIDGVPKLPKERTNAMLDKRAHKRHGDAAIALCLGYAAASDADQEQRRWAALSSDQGAGYAAGW